MESNFDKFERGELHPMALQLAKDMTAELVANEHKGDWSDWLNVSEILSELEWHKAKLLFAIRNKDTASICEHIADCANILMFLGNALGVYESAKTEAIKKEWINLQLK